VVTRGTPGQKDGAETAYLGHKEAVCGDRPSERAKDQAGVEDRRPLPGATTKPLGREGATWRHRRSEKKSGEVPAVGKKKKKRGLPWGWGVQKTTGGLNPPAEDQLRPRRRPFRRPCRRSTHRVGQGQPRKRADEDHDPSPRIAGPGKRGPGDSQTRPEEASTTGWIHPLEKRKEVLKEEYKGRSGRALFSKKRNFAT